MKNSDGLELDYVPPFTITDKIMRHVSSISEKLGKLSKFENLQSKPHLRRNNKVKSVHASVRIEANSLSFVDALDILNGKQVLGDRKEIQEIKNAYAAYERLAEIDVYSLEELKYMHGLMTKYLLDEAGVFRRGEEGVFAGGVCIFMAPPARLVPELMRQLFVWMQMQKDVVHPLILAAVFHYEFVFIHPFADGNGRMARLWHSAILSKWRPVFEFIPMESQIERFQEEYYGAISQCHALGTSTPFIEFFLEKLDGLLDEFTQELLETHEEPSKYVKTLLRVMQEGTYYSANELLELLNLKSKETLRKNYLGPAIKSGLIRMLLPDKPNSKNQAYVKVGGE
ncbi:MAG: Fic family protein [Phascolarctobacterium sp.]|nr:Fic family protein [Phascolarctobacterium sp.]